MAAEDEELALLAVPEAAEEPQQQPSAAAGTLAEATGGGEEPAAVAPIDGSAAVEPSAQPGNSSVGQPAAGNPPAPPADAAPAPAPIPAPPPANATPAAGQPANGKPAPPAAPPAAPPSQAATSTAPAKQPGGTAADQQQPPQPAAPGDPPAAATPPADAPSSGLAPPAVAAAAAAQDLLEELPVPKAKAGAGVYEMLVQEIRAARAQQRLTAKALEAVQRNLSAVAAGMAGPPGASGPASDEELAARVGALVGHHLRAAEAEMASLRAGARAAAKREHAALCLLATLAAALALNMPAFGSAWPAARTAATALAVANGLVGLALHWQASRAHALPLHPHALPSLPAA